MPRVPMSDFSPVQADTSVLMPARADTSAASPELAAVPGRQAQQTGGAILNAGGTALSLAARVQDDVNTVRRVEAMNQLRQVALDLQYNTESGYLTQMGGAVMGRASGKTLADEYGDKLQEAIGQISSKLDNDAQRQDFALHAADVSASFQAGIQQHTLREWERHSLSVWDGAIKLSADDAKRNWDDPVKIDTALQEMKSAVVHAGQLKGESANETLAKLKVGSSLVHVGVIDSALQNGNPTYASQYLQKYRDEMTADDILKVNGVLNREIDARVASEAVNGTSQAFAAAFQPTSMDRLQGIVLGMESGGRDINPDGSPLTSAKGAKYGMQVMPDTAKNPGFGIVPARNDSPAEYNRVGREYLGKLVEKYGNVAQALAAYNAGPGAVDDALKRAKRSQKLNQFDPAVKPIDWLSFLPKETQNYVRRGVDTYSAGGGATPPPSELEWVNHAIGLLGPNPRPEQVRLTRDGAEQQYALFVKAAKQHEEESVTTAMRGILENGGRYSDLPISVRAAVPPKEVGGLLNFAQKISKGDDSTSLWLYNKLTNNPDSLARMSDNEFFALRRELSEADFKHFSEQRAKLSGALGGNNGPGDLNSQAIKQSLDARLRMLNIDPTPKDDGGADAARIGAVRRFVDQYFTGAQREAGKKFTDAEVSQHIDALFAKNATFRGWFSNSSGPMLGMRASDIDSATKDSIKTAFKRRGVDNPTDAQILSAYWTMKATRK